MAGIVIVKLLVTLLATLIAYGVYQLSRVIYEEFTLPTRDLPGPKSTNLLFGNIKDVQEDVCPYARVNLPIFFLMPTQQELVFRERWVQEYGTVFRLKGLFSVCAYCYAILEPIQLSTNQLSCLYIADTKTLSHILMNTSYDYQKAKISRYSLSLLLGPGAHAIEFFIFSPRLIDSLGQAFLLLKKTNINSRYRDDLLSCLIFNVQEHIFFCSEKIMVRS
jgi:hypothetical protein